MPLLSCGKLRHEFGSSVFAMFKIRMTRDTYHIYMIYTTEDKAYKRTHSHTEQECLTQACSQWISVQILDFVAMKERCLPLRCMVF